MLEQELEKGKGLINESTQKEYDSKRFSKNVRNCVGRLNDFSEKLEQANEKLSLGIEGQDGEQEINQLINSDWSFITEVTLCRDDLLDILQSFEVQKSPS